MKISGQSHIPQFEVKLQVQDPFQNCRNLLPYALTNFKKFNKLRYKNFVTIKIDEDEYSKKEKKILLPEL